jgi:hypothetical protein
MGKKRLCDCGAAADWEEIGSTWLCTACRDKDVKKKIGEFRKALEKLERLEGALRMLKVDTVSITELLGELKVEINKRAV